MPTNRCRIIFAVVFCLPFAACDKVPEQPSERETEATSLLRSSFRATQEYWFGAETPLGRGEPRLVELRKAHPTILGQTVNDTERLNGISDRFTLTVNCEQMRYWHRKTVPGQNGSKVLGVEAGRSLAPCWAEGSVTGWFGSRKRTASGISSQPMDATSARIRRSSIV